VADQNATTLERSVPSRPKALRLKFVLAEIAIRVLPQGAFVTGVGPSTAKWTLRVTTRIVRSPSTGNSPSPMTLMPGSLEVQDRELFHMKEVGALEVSIALFVAGVNGSTAGIFHSIRGALATAVQPPHSLSSPAFSR
jgi:hypothetical protein